MFQTQPIQQKTHPNAIQYKNPSKSIPIISISHIRPKTYKSYKSILLISVMYYLSFIYFGYTFSNFNSIDFKLIINVYRISLPKSTAHGVYSGIPALGALIGACSTHFMVKKLSRNKSFITVNIIAIIAGCLILVPNMYTLLISRFIQGACVGLFTCITPLTVKQISPIQILGTMGGLNNITLSIGIVLGYLFGSLSSHYISSNNLEYIQCLIVFGFSLIILIVQLIWVIFIFPYETPKYLLVNNRKDEAIRMIQMIYKKEYVEMILKEKQMENEKSQERIKVQQQEQQEQYQQQQGQQYNQQYVQQNKNNKNIKDNKNIKQHVQDNNYNNAAIKPDTHISSHIAPSTWLTILISFYLITLQQFSGAILFTVYMKQFSYLYFRQIQKQFPVIIFSLKLIFSIISTCWLFNMIGRKKILFIGMGIQSIGIYVFVYGVYMVVLDSNNIEFGKVLIMIGLIICTCCFISTIGPLGYLYCAEVLPPQIYPYLVCFKWSLQFLLITIFPFIKKHSIHQTGVEIFLFLFVYCFIGFIVINYLLVETKDKNQVEISQGFQQKYQIIKKWCNKDKDSKEEQNLNQEGF